MNNHPLSFKGVTADSREVKPGYVFVAIKGLTVDGHDYIDSAVKNGAVKIYGERTAKKLPVPYEKVVDSRQTLGDLASAFYGSPSEKLKVIGVTGTKGKTTTVHLIYHILTTLGKKAGMVSSIKARIGGKEMPLGFHVTNPDVVSLNKFLKEMVNANCEYAVVEVSSHGIDQGRIAGINFEVGVLTNIAPEHLDYHKTFKEYKRVKLSFVNSTKHKIISPKDTDLNFLPGKFNNLNAQAAVDAVVALGINLQKAEEAVKSFVLPDGRMEEIPTDKGYRVFVDFAHTPDSLEASLTYLKSITKGKLIAVFGCAGLRDRRKRLKMGRISTRIADLSVFTAEDPRTENIFDILRSMRKKATKKFFTIPERAEAIAYAIGQAQKGDVIAFLGKSHEKSMAYLHFEHPWNEKEMIDSQLNHLSDTSAIIMAAGKGTRMKSRHPKVLREICGRPIMAYLLESLRRVGVADIVAVVSFRKNEVIRRFPYSISYATQLNPKGGTGDAVRTGLSKVSKNSKYVFAFYGDDSAFFRSETTKAILKDHIAKKATISFASLKVEDPFGLGRVIRDKAGDVINIVEEKEADEKQKKVNEVNCGHFVFNKDWLVKNIESIRTSTTGEIYLVDLIKMAIQQSERVNAYILKYKDEWHGINTPEQLEQAEAKMKKRLLN